MRLFARLIACGVLLTSAGIVLSDDSCDLCGGSKQVKCFQFQGKGGMGVVCPACLGNPTTACMQCQGTGTRPCMVCNSTGQIRGFKCLFCKGNGKIDCSLCDRGKVKCPVCDGDGTVAVDCDLCKKTGKLPCPECSAMQVPCNSCQGTSAEKCPACGGKGKVTTLCATCGGRRNDPCAPCSGYGSLVCQQCGGLGASTRRNYEGAEVLQGNPCRACNGAGRLKCAACKGKGCTPCQDCAGKGTTPADCWLCEGQKAIPCRRCTVAKCFRGKHPQEAVRVSVFRAGTFQPQIAQGLKNQLKMGDLAVWRIVIDAKECNKRFSLGGEDGWELVLVNAAGTEVRMTDAYAGLSPEKIAILEKLLVANGDDAEALKRPFRVVNGTVRTCLAIAPKEAGDDVALARLRLPKDTTIQPLDLMGSDVYWNLWVKERVLAAPK